MAAAQVVGLDELRRELRKLEEPRAWSKELGAVHRVIGRKAAGWAQAEAGRMGGVQKHFATAIRGYGTVQAARIAVARPEANAAFWGAKQRTGWNAGNQTPNQPAWVGNSWQAGVRGQGPYAMNDALADHIDDVIDEYGDGIDRLTRRAFPD